MKYIVAVIQPQKLDSVRDALVKAGVVGLTVSDVQGYGRQKGHTEMYRGHEYTVHFVRKVKLEIACDDKIADTVVDSIVRFAKSGDEGRIGDGKVFVLDLQDAVRIRTAERGSEAL